MVALLLINAFVARRDLVWRYAGIVGLAGLWVTSAFWAYVAVKSVELCGWFWGLWGAARRLVLGREREPDGAGELDRGRREFLQKATLAAGAAPFACGAYGFLIGRRKFQVREVNLQVKGWQPALDGLRIVQLSDIHIGSYLSAADVRRVTGMANELKPDLALVTGDLISGEGDPLEDCVRELARLQAPLGVWGCNGNHEIYAQAEAAAAALFARNGMYMLRQQNVEIVRHAESFNLIGVDYQRPPGRGEQPLAMLQGVDGLVRPDIPNILLSHNPNAFPRAAEMGIELMLSGHTHGGQVTIEILDKRLSPARFLTRYVAGLFARPAGSKSWSSDEEAWLENPGAPASLLYVNRGLGTIFAPVRLGVPPEISLITIRAQARTAEANSPKPASDHRAAVPAKLPARAPV